MRRRELLERLVVVGASLPGFTLAAAPKPEVQVFKSRTCSCCAVWVGHLREVGFKVTVLVHCHALLCTYLDTVARAALARVTLARMSLALAVQMKGFGLTL
jgi:hypothetical protein